MRESPAELTPMMRQYGELKRRFPDYLLLFRLGDFYELFFQDAQTASRLLQLTLTSRQKGEGANGSCAWGSFGNRRRMPSSR